MTLGWKAWTSSDRDWLRSGAVMWWSQADHNAYRSGLEAGGFEITTSSYTPDGTSGHALFCAYRRPRRPSRAT